MVTDSKIRPGAIQPGALVRDNRSRVGRVAGSSEAVVVGGESVNILPVDFWGELQKRPVEFLSPLDENSPEAILWKRPEDLQSWAEEAPQKLVALALSVDGGTGRVSDIRAKLHDRVIDSGRWESWWKKQPPLMRKMPDHFRITKVGKDNEYTLLTCVEAVVGAGGSNSSQSPERGAVTASDWKTWLEAHTRSPAPGRFPTRQVTNSLARCPAESIEAVLFRLIVGAEELVAARETSPQVAEGWLRAVVRAALRWRESGGSDPRGYTAARVGEILARLAGIAGERTPQELLLQAGALDGATEAWRRGFLAGLWESFEGEDAREMYLNSSAALGRQARSDLAKEMFLAAFGPDFSNRRHAELDRLLDAVPESQRTPLLNEVIATAAADQRDLVLGYLTNSRHSSGEERFSLRLLAALALGGGRGEFAASVSDEMVDVLEQPQNYGSNLGLLFYSVRTKLEEDRITTDMEVLPRVSELERQLERERQEQDRLRQQVRERNAELAANREESRLELRQDMLLAVGEVLQSVHRRNGSGEPAGDVAAGLALALRAGGAEPLGTPGKVVEFDPELHQAEKGAPDRSLVRVVAPGVVYRVGIHGDRVLLKAQVKHEAG